MAKMGMDKIVRRVLNIIIIFQLMAIWLFGLMLGSIPEMKVIEATRAGYRKGYEKGYTLGYSDSSEGLSMNLYRRRGKLDYKVTLIIFFGLPVCMWIVMSMVCRRLDKEHTIWWHMTRGWIEVILG